MSKRTIFIALVSGLTFLGCLLLLLGCLYLINRADQELDERRKTAALAQAQRESSTLLGRLIEESKEERAEIASYVLLSEDEVINLLGLLKMIGEEQGVSLSTESLQVVPEKDKGPFEKVSVTIKVEGSYERVIHILKMLESLPMQSSLVQVSMDRGGETGEWTGEFHLTITKQKAS